MLEKINHWMIVSANKEKMNELYGSENLEVFGLCVYSESTIYISDDIVCEVELKKTIIHELVHAVVTNYCVGTDSKREAIPNFVEYYIEEIKMIEKLADECIESWKCAMQIGGVSIAYLKEHISTEGS